MSESVQTGNEPETTVETIKVDNHEVELKTTGTGAEAKIEIEQPEGLEGEALKKFQDKATQVISGMAKVNKKGFELNKREKELEQEVAKLREEKAKATLQESSKKIPTITELAIEKSGLSKSDYYELEPEERDVFRDTATAEISAMKASQSNQNADIRKFISDGGDYNKLVSHAQSLGTSITPKLIENYKALNKKETTQVFSTKTLADIQSGQISFVPKGGISAKGTNDPARLLNKLANEDKRL